MKTQRLSDVKRFLLKDEQREMRDKSACDKKTLNEGG